MHNSTWRPLDFFSTLPSDCSSLLPQTRHCYCFVKVIRKTTALQSDSLRARYTTWSMVRRRISSDAAVHDTRRSESRENNTRRRKTYWTRHSFVNSCARIRDVDLDGRQLTKRTARPTAHRKQVAREETTKEKPGELHREKEKAKI